MQFSVFVCQNVLAKWQQKYKMYMTKLIFYSTAKHSERERQTYIDFL